MALFVNFLIIALIIGAAGYQIYRVVKRAKKADNLVRQANQSCGWS